MRNFNRLIQLVAVAAVVLLGRSDTAWAALNYNPSNSLVASIPGAGQSTTSSITVSSTTSGLTAVTLGTVAQNNGTWLCPTVSGTTITLNIGSSGCSTSQLTAGGTYNASFPISGNNGDSGTIFVTLQVSGSGGTTNGFTFAPNPVTFSAAAVGATVAQQAVTLSYNGQTATPSSVSATTGTNQNWLQPYVSGSSVVVAINAGAVTTNGTYTGTVSVNTNFGSTSFPVTLNVGTTGSTSGLSFSPNPVTLYSSTPGGSVSPQTVTVTYNGAPVNVSSVTYSTTTGQSWLTAQVFGSGVQVGANTAVVGVGTYNGTVVAQTTYGSVSIPVNLGVGTNGTAGLVANPTQANFTIAVGSGTSPQTVTVTYNGQATTVSSVQLSYGGSGNWLLVTPSASGVTLAINGSNLLAGTYTATVTINTPSGSAIVPVNLTVGSGGGTTSGLSATPNPVSLSTPSVNGAVTAQTVAILFSGSPVTVTNVSTSTNTGQSWLQAALIGNNQISVGANTFGLSVGNYSGTVIVTTANYGTTTFVVNLSVGTTGTTGLTASPNPVTLNTAQSGGSVLPQVVTINYNGSPASITGVSSVTATGQNWLVASSLGGTVNVAANTAGLTAGLYTGTVTVTTTSGQTSFQVNLTVGSSGGSSNGYTASPNPVTFTESAAGQGGSQTVTVNFNGAVVPVTNATFSPSDLFTSFVNVTVNANGTVTLNLNNIATNPGNYSGTLLLYTANSQVNVPVTLQIGGVSTQGLAASPNPVNFSVQTGGTAAAQTVNITSNGAAIPVTSVSASTTTGQAWLVPTASGSSVIVNVLASTLGPGTYTGTVNATTSAGLATFTVNLSVGQTSGGTVTVAPAMLSFAYELGQAQPQSQSLTLGTSAGSTGYTATSSATWLTVSPASGTAPGNLSVGVNTAGLAAGTYTGNVLITAAGSSTPQTIPVTLVVSATTLFQLSASAPVFTAPTGSTTPLTQTLQVLSTDTQSITFSTQASSNGNWLTVSAPVITTPTTLTITANPAGLAQGTYSGTITLTATNLVNVANSPLVIPITLTVGQGGTTGGTLASSPATLSFTQVVSGGSPAAQQLAVTGPAGSTFSAVASLPFGQNWLTVTPSSFVVPATLTATVNAGTLAQGSYTGSILISGTGGTQSIPVTLTVTSTPIVPAALTITPGSLQPVSFQVGGANPAAQTLAVSIATGAALGFTAGATTSTGGAWLTVSPAAGTTPGNLVVSINPANLSAGTYNGLVTITANGATSSPVTLPITLTVSPAAVANPSIVAIQNAASSVPTSLSPGQNIVIYGTNMGPATLSILQLSSGGTVATSVAGTQVTFDGVPAPIIYTKNTQVSVMVPYEIAGRATTSVVVAYNGVSSNALLLRVVDTAPGIYTLNQTGAGQGAILNQNGTVNGPQNPDIAGDIIQIFMTGEGQTSPAGVDGAVTPNRLPVPTPALPVTVEIGGKPVPAADVTFAGEAPGLIAGVLQVNAKIPSGVGTGPVSVVVKVNGVASQANVTVSVR